MVLGILQRMSVIQNGILWNTLPYKIYCHMYNVRLDLLSHFQIFLHIDTRISGMVVVEKQVGRGKKVIGLPERLRKHGRRGRRVLGIVDLRGIQQIRRSRTVR